jgi:hypothetical protein
MPLIPVKEIIFYPVYEMLGCLSCWEGDHTTGIIAHPYKKMQCRKTPQFRKFGTIITLIFSSGILTTSDPLLASRSFPIRFSPFISFKISLKRI